MNKHTQPYKPCLERYPCPRPPAYTPSHAPSNPYTGGALTGAKRENSLIYIRPKADFLLRVPSTLCYTPCVCHPNRELSLPQGQSSSTVN